MSLTSNDKARTPAGVGALSTGVTLAGGNVRPVERVHSKALVPIRHKVNIPGLVYTVATTSGGGAADSLGQKLMTLPEGKWMVLGWKIDLDVITSAGVSTVDSVFAIGTALASASEDTLTSTEADVLSSQTLGADGSIVAATSEAMTIYPVGTGSAVAMVGSVTAATDLYLNIAGNFVHATESTGTVTLSGTIEMLAIDLGDL